VVLSHVYDMPSEAHTCTHLHTHDHTVSHMAWFLTHGRVARVHEEALLCLLLEPDCLCVCVCLQPSLCVCVSVYVPGGPRKRKRKTQPLLSTRYNGKLHPSWAPASLDGSNQATLGVAGLTLSRAASMCVH